MCGCFDEDMLDTMAKILADPTDLDTLMFMQNHGSSVTLNYGEDTGEWECCWITGGNRFRDTHRIVAVAIGGAFNKCFNHAVSSRIKDTRDWCRKAGI